MIFDLDETCANLFPILLILFVDRQYEWIFDPDEHTDLVFWSRFLMYDSKNITFSNPDELLVISNYDSKINQYNLSLYILQFRKI